MSLLERLPEAHRIGPTAVTVPTTESVVTLLSKHKERLVFVDDTARLTFDYRLASFKADELNALAVAAFKERGEVPNGEYELHPDLPLSPYQKVALSCADRSEGYALFMQQGTGKTPIVIALACNAAKALDEDRAYRVLITCPNNVRHNWQSEIHRFATCPVKTQVLRGGVVKRTDQFLTLITAAGKAKVIFAICSYGSIVSTPTLFGVDWDLAVLDESHYIKWPRTTRYKKGAIKLRDCSKKRLCLTGTPVTNAPFDLWSQFEFLGEGESGFTSFEAFRSFYGVFDNRNTHASGHERLVGLQNLPFLKEKLARKAFIISKEEALPDLPDKVYDTHEVEMTKAQADFYKDLAAHLALEIEADLETSENKQLTINNVLVKLLRLAQITSGFVSWDPVVDPETGDVLRERVIEPLDPNPKIDGLLELIKEKPYESKTIIWASFRENIRAIRAALADNGYSSVEFTGSTSDKDRQAAEEAFNRDPDCRFFVGNPGAGGVGLNLLGYPPGEESYASNCDHVIYYSQDWSSTKRSQSEDRAHRRGARSNVRITDLVVPETIDEDIRVRVMNKIANAMELQDLRELLRKLLS